MRMLECEMFPIAVILVTDEAEYYKLTKKAKTHDGYPGTGAACTISYSGGDQGVVALVVVGDYSESLPEEINSLLTHEAVHIKQFLFEEIGEDTIGAETEAYAIQYFSNYLIKEFWYRENKKDKVHEQS